MVGVSERRTSVAINGYLYIRALEAPSGGSVVAIEIKCLILRGVERYCNNRKSFALSSYEIYHKDNNVQYIRRFFFCAIYGRNH